jgi:hypothetical protein
MLARQPIEGQPLLDVLLNSAAELAREPATWRDKPPDRAWRRRDRADRQKVPLLRLQRLHFLRRRSNLASGHGVHPQVTSTSPACMTSLRAAFAY